MNIDPRQGETVSSTYNPSLPMEHSSTDKRLSPPLERNPDIDTLRKELDSRDSTITELKYQLKNLQTIVEQLTKENSVLKTSSVDDDQSVTSQISMNDSMASNVTEKPQERGKSLESEFKEDAEVRQAKSAQRPVSMYEAREGPKNNWQVTKHQVLICINFTNFYCFSWLYVLGSQSDSFVKYYLFRVVKKSRAINFNAHLSVYSHVISQNINYVKRLIYCNFAEYLTRLDVFLLFFAVNCFFVLG